MHVTRSGCAFCFGILAVASRTIGIIICTSISGATLVMFSTSTWTGKYGGVRASARG
jgi:hypothetical protein